MRKFMLCFASIFVSFLLLNVPHAHALSKKEGACVDLFLKAAEELARRDFKQSFKSYYIVAFNDVLCEKPEAMANVVIVVNLEYDDGMYGIFHIHATYDGTLVRATSFDDQRVWAPLVKIDSWKQPWCDLIRIVYKEELEEQWCEK